MSGQGIPTLTVVAGPPGAGKSTFIASQRFDGRVYEVGNDARRDFLNPRAEPDPRRVVPPTREAAMLRSATVEARAGSLVVETTLSGRDAFRLVDRAIDRGYRVDGYFVGVDRVDTAIARVEQRMATGGVGMPNAIVARQFDRSLQNLDRLASRVDSLVLIDNSQRRAETKVAFEHGRLVFAAAEKPQWAAGLVERAEATALTDAQALVRPFRSPEFKDSLGRGIDERSVHTAAMRDPQTRARMAEVALHGERAFVNAERLQGGVEATVRASSERYHEAAATLVREGTLRGSDGFFSTERSRNERQDALKASGEFVRALDRAKGAYEEAAGRYISSVQDQRMRDRVAVPNLSGEARNTLTRIEQAERTFLRDPQEAAKLYRAIDSAPRSREILGEFQRLESAARERFGDQLGVLAARAAGSSLPAGLSADSARLVSAGSRAVVTVISRTAYADVTAERSRGNSMSL